MSLAKERQVTDCERKKLLTITTRTFLEMFSWRVAADTLTHINQDNLFGQPKRRAVFQQPRAVSLLQSSDAAQSVDRCVCPLPTGTPLLRYIFGNTCPQEHGEHLGLLHKASICGFNSEFTL